MTREARLLKVYALANEICKNYTFEKYCDMLDLCKDDIFIQTAKTMTFTQRMNILSMKIKGGIKCLELI